MGVNPFDTNNEPTWQTIASRNNTPTLSINGFQDWQKQFGGNIFNYMNYYGITDSNIDDNFAKDLAKYYGGLSAQEQVKINAQDTNGFLGKMYNNETFMNTLKEQYEANAINPNAQSSMDKAAQGMSIFGSTMQGLNSLSQIGLGWANYAENRERLKQLNELTKEQIASSREMREQRRKEIERLNKARTYTKNAYGKGTTITRSVM